MKATVLHTDGIARPTSVWRRLPDERWLILAIIGLGLAIRLLFVITHGLNRSDGEAEHVAIALATGRGFADAYFIGSGPTAHLTPYTPALGGLIYWLFGVQSPLSDAIMVTWSLGCFTASALLLNRLFRLLGSPAPARLAALGVMCCLPVFLRHETATFRFWEGQLAFALLLLSLSRTVVEAIGATPLQSPLHASMPIAAAFLVNPIFGLAGGVGFAMVQVGRRAWRRLAAVTLLALLLVAPPMAAWAARNQAVLGQPVVMRDNVGLELALKNNDDVLQHGLGRQVQERSIVRIHPGERGPGRRRLRQIGELAYLAELKQQSYAWITAHPGAFGQIAIAGLLQNLFPPRYQFDSAGTLRCAVIWLVDALGLLTFVAMIVGRRRGWPSVATSTLLISAAYAPFIYQWRYHYPVYNLLLFAAASGVWACWTALTKGRSEYAVAR